jgi:tetratricopeptide (TPR) repeat protein
MQSDFYAAYGNVYSGLNEYQKALQMYDRAAGLNPEIFRTESDLNLRIGEAHFRSADPAKAIPYLEKAINLGNPTSRPYALIVFGDCLKQTGDMECSFTIYAEAAKANDAGAAVAASVRLATMLEERDMATSKKISENTFRRVTGIYTGILAKYPDSSAIVALNMGKLYSIHGNIPDAFGMFYDAWRLTRQTDPIHDASRRSAERLFGRLCIEESSKWDVALLGAYSAYRNTILKDMDDLQSNLKIAGILIESDRLDEASFISTRLMKSELPDARRQALLLSALIETKKGNLVRALDLTNGYLKATDKTKASETAVIEKASLLMMLGRYRDSLNFLEGIKSSGTVTVNELRLMADLYDRFNERSKEMLTLDEIITQGKAGSPIYEYALFTRACSLADAEPARALGLFSRLVKDFPGSQLSSRASFIMSVLSDGNTNLNKEVKYPYANKNSQAGLTERTAALFAENLRLGQSLKRYFKPETESVKIPSLHDSHKGGLQ